MDILKLMLLAAEEDDSAFDGLFSGAKDVMGIVLMVTGALIIYIAVKVFKGYRFLPSSEATVIEEDNYVEGEARAVEKLTSVMPDFNGGEDREFVEWRISYTVDGEEYEQVIPDDGYKKGDVLKIKYDPAKPSAFYLIDEEETRADEEDGASNQQANTSRTTGLVLVVLGVLVVVGGAALKFT